MWTLSCAHCYLLMQVHAELERTARADLAQGQGWLLRARAGLSQLLRAKVAPAQRQAMLQLAAAVTAVGGPYWLLASSRAVVRTSAACMPLRLSLIRDKCRVCQTKTAVCMRTRYQVTVCMACSQGELPESFFQLLVESTKVEALIGLRDAMAPENLVPLPGRAARPSGQPQAKSASSSAEDVSG